MRKLLWCCSVAGVLAAGTMFSASYYAARHPDSVAGRCISTVAGGSAVARPIASIATVIARAAQNVLGEPATTETPGSAEECVPEEPRPIEAEAPAEIGIVERLGHDSRGDEVAPIVIHEDEPAPAVEDIPPSTIDIAGMQEPADAVCPMVMPYCVDDDEAVPPTPNMPLADAGDTKPAGDSEESDDGAFRAWMKLFEGGSSREEKVAGEELHAPKEDIPGEPKCQEDCHRHESYSGCPHMTCPYTGKTYPCEPPAKSGKEEISEPPAPKPIKHKKHGNCGQSCPNCTEGVDTMEYRRSDGGLNEYGRGPL